MPFLISDRLELIRKTDSLAITSSPSDKEELKPISLLCAFVP